MSTRHESFTVDATPRLDIRITAGEIAVRAAAERTGTGREVRVGVEAADADELTIAQLGSTITIAQEARWRFRSRSARVLVDVPVGSDVEVTSVSAEVRLSGPLGAARVRTTSGDISVDAAERLEISTVSGSCRIGEVGTDSRLSAVSGHLAGRRVGGRLEATTASGDVRVSRVDGDLVVATTSGDVRIDRCHGDDVSAKSVSGDLAIGLPAGIRVDADLSTLSGRTILPEPRPAPVDRLRRQVRVRLRSVSGDLRIDRVESGTHDGPANQ